MKKSYIRWAIAGGVVLLIVLVPSCTYNRLVRLQQATDSQWSQVQNVYQRRSDLVPNLVATVSGAANFEKSTVTQVTEARASVGKVTIDASKAPDDAKSLAQYEQAQGQLSSALSRLLVVAERYPDLKATSNFHDLQAQLEGTENRISVERGRFNDTVQAYDTAIKSFPSVLFAGAMGFKERPYFAAAAGAQNAPKVQFNFGPSSPASAPASP